MANCSMSLSQVYMVVWTATHTCTHTDLQGEGSVVKPSLKRWRCALKHPEEEPKTAFEALSNLS